MAQTDSGWRISPYHLNIQVGDDRYLQLLNDSAQELRGAMWSLDDPEKAEHQSYPVKNTDVFFRQKDA